METIVLTGCRGQLGTELMRCLSAGQTELGPAPAELRDARVIPVDVDELDITDPDAVTAFVREKKPTAILNCAAFTNVDACETQEPLAYRVNALGPKNLAAAAADIGAYVLHISTDYVFDGQGDAPYREDAPPHPVSAYGRTKYEGEQFLLEACPDAAIVRTAWLYGYTGKNFVRTILRLAGERDTVTVVNDQYGNPTNAADLADHLLKLLAARAAGVYHCTGRGVCSWYEFACEIVRLSGLGTRVLPCASADYPTPTRRPAYSALDHSRLAAAVGDAMRPWQEALQAFFREESMR